MKAIACSFAVLAILAACLPESQDRPDVTCANACKKRIVGCTAHECDRGCAFVIDRLVEHEQESVLKCMVDSPRCADSDWAQCAVHVGAHADGGPGVPPPLELE